MLRKKYELIEDGDKSENLINVNIDAPEACSRYAARVITGLKVGASPEWLKERLESIGLHSINNVVDAANYVLMDLGHPLHTFDLNNIKGNTINVRFAKKGEKFTTLDNIERKLEKFHQFSKRATHNLLKITDLFQP